ncbi:MAG: TonB-dependent receptor plug domain-containing protein [Bacteroidia bacterium]|nr:TonB-dependent receptor plug domain-containing protein [Bacteroidia bacterium]
MNKKRSHIVFLLLGSLFLSSSIISAQNNVAANEDSIYISQELSETRVVGQKSKDNFTTIKNTDISTQPTINGGIESIVRTQLGVSSNSELSSQYRVRGGNFDENMVYLNGIQIYRPFLIRQGEQEGLSIVNPDMVDRVEFSAGGYDVSYADKSSSVLSVNYRTPQRSEYSARLSLLGAEAYVGRAMGQLSGSTAIRYRTNSYILGSLDTKGEYEPSFLDAQSFWNLKLSNNAFLSILGYLASNKYDFIPQNRTTTFGTISNVKTLKIYFDGKEKDKFLTGIAALQGGFRINRSSLLLSAQYYRSAERESYDILGEYWLQQADDAQSSTSISQAEGIGIGAMLSHARNELYSSILSFDAKSTTRHSKEHTSRFGITYNTEYHDVNANEWERIDSAGYSTQIKKLRARRELTECRPSAFITHSWTPYISDSSTLGMELGLRYSYSDISKEHLVSPRLIVRYRPKASTVLRFAAGMYANAPMLKERLRLDGSFNDNLKAQREWHYILGLDHDFYANDLPFRFTVEAYYKRLYRIVPYNIANVKISYKGDNCADGFAVGADVRISGELIRGVESWLTLSYLNTMENVDNDGMGYMPRPSDQRFSISAMLRDQLPNNASMGATLNLFMATGLPFSMPDSFSHSDNHRMPGYKRVDLGIYKDFAIMADGRKKWQNGCRELLLGIDFFNLFDIQNTISYFWVKDTQKHDLAVPNYLTSRRFNIRLSIAF